MEYKIVFFKTGENYDVNFDFQSRTCAQTQEHGFAIEVIDGIPVINTLKGFGAFEDAKRRCTDWVHLYTYIDECKKYIFAEEDTKKRKLNTKILLELQTHTASAINKKLALMMSA